MQKILSINQIKVYSRKQVIGWVGFNGFVFEQLKNGLFFIKILRKLVPNDVGRHKVNEKAINVYEQTQNMNIVKKILNKHNLQLNLNVQSVVASKNCFELANWFKNLYDQNKSDKDTEYNYSEKSRTPSKIMDQIPVSITNYKSLVRASSSSNKKKDSSMKKIGRVTSGFIGINKKQVMNQTMKLPKESFDSQIAYKISAKMNETTERMQQISRTLRPSQLQKLSRSRSKNSKLISKNWLNSPITGRKNLKVWTQQQNVMNLMKIESLQQQMVIYEKTLKKISKYIKQNEKITDMQKIKKQVISIIYNFIQKQTQDQQTQQIQQI